MAPAPPRSEVETIHLSEKAWLAQVRSTLSTRLNVDPSELKFSTGRTGVAFVRQLEVKTRARRGAPRRHYRIEVFDPHGKPRGSFPAITVPGNDEPPKDLAFLGEAAVIYEVPLNPPEPAAPPTRASRRRETPSKHAARASHGGKAQALPKQPTQPTEVDASVFLGARKRLFVVQPVKRNARAKRCEGVAFAFNRSRDQVVFVGGKPDAAMVAVNGLQVYPRRGRTVVVSEPAWSRDGSSLAFVEAPRRQPGRLVLLAAPDNPTGDTIWTLPTGTSMAGVKVFWVGPGKLVVGKTAMRPLFATSFSREEPKSWDP